MSDTSSENNPSPPSANDSPRPRLTEAESIWRDSILTLVSWGALFGFIAATTLFCLVSVLVLNDSNWFMYTGIVGGGFLMAECVGLIGRRMHQMGVPIAGKYEP